MKLAAFDSGQNVEPSDPVIQKYQKQFDSLRAISIGVNDDALANMAYVVSQSELKKGIKESNLSVLEAINQACPSEISQGKNLADIFAAYATLRRQGMTKEQTISQIHGMVESIVHPGR